MNRCVVVGGASIRRYDLVRRYLQPGDFIIFCDSGLKHREALGVKADLVVGDFDSHPRPTFEVETITLPREKDDTDTRYAVKEALKRGFDRFLLLGMVGERLDHTLGNVSLLVLLFGLGKEALLVDDYSEMEMVGAEEKTIEPSFAYFSLLNITGNARGISIRNAKYPLEDGEIPSDYQYGISNETVPGGTAAVRVGEGSALLIRVFPEE